MRLPQLLREERSNVDVLEYLFQLQSQSKLIAFETPTPIEFILVKGYIFLYSIFPLERLKIFVFSNWSTD